MIDQRLSGNVFQNTSGVYTDAGHDLRRPAITPAELTEYLHRSGYTTDGSKQGWAGTPSAKPSVEIIPGAESYFHGTNALHVEFGGRDIDDIHEVQKATT